MAPWSGLPQFRQTPIGQALNVRHEVVHLSPDEFVHMGFSDAGVAHDVLYEGPCNRDLTRFQLSTCLVVAVRADGPLQGPSS